MRRVSSGSPPCLVLLVSLPVIDFLLQPTEILLASRPLDEERHFPVYQGFPGPLILTPILPGKQDTGKA